MELDSSVAVAQSGAPKLLSCLLSALGQMSLPVLEEQDLCLSVPVLALVWLGRWNLLQDEEELNPEPKTGGQ